MKNYQRLLGSTLFTLAFGYAGALQAEGERPLYLGASVWRSNWNVGVSDKQSENAMKGAPIANAIANAALRSVFTSSNQYTTAFVNGPSDATLNNLGVFGSYGISDAWNLTFNASYGSTDFQAERTNVFGSSSSTQSGADVSILKHDITARRTDLDAIFSRRIGTTSFALFGGLKVQDWRYEAAPVNGPHASVSNSIASGGSAVSGSNLGAVGFRYTYDSRAYGPSLGLIYTWSIDREQAFSAQLGLVYLFGNLTMIEKNDGYTPAYTLTGGGNSLQASSNSYLIRDEIKDRLEMPGFLVAGYYRRTFGSLMLRVGLFYQEMAIVSKAPEDTGYTFISGDGSRVLLPATPRRLQPEFSVDGAKDVFKGIAVSVMKRIW